MKKVYSKNVLEALRKVCDIITSSMGPGGRLVGIRSSFEQIYQQTRDLSKDSNVMFRDEMATKDGVTIARFVKMMLAKHADSTMDDDAALEAFIASMVCEAADKTMREVGDGTTTVSHLVCKLYESAMKELESGANEDLHEFNRGMAAAMAEFEKAVNGISRSVKTKGGYNKSYLEGIATVSANNDAALGKLVAEAVAKVGLMGVVRVLDSPYNKEYIAIENGYTFPGGALTENQLIDNVGKRSSEITLDNPFVLIVNKKIENIESLNPILAAWQQWCEENNHIVDIMSGGARVKRINVPLILVIGDIEGSALTTLQLNLNKGTHPVYLVKAPYQGQARENILQDLKAVAGCHQVFSTMEGRDILRFGKDFPGIAGHLGVSRGHIDEFGGAIKVVLTKDKMVLLPAEDRKEDIDEHLGRMKMSLEKLGNVVDEELSDRVTRLSCGIAHLYLTAKTPTELGDRRELADDAIKAAMSAIKFGVVAGGGRAMHWIQVNKFKGNWDSKKSFDKGYQAFWACLDAPMNKILENCYVNAEGIAKIKEYLLNATAAYGVIPMAVSQGKKDFFTKGILDPARMPISAMSNAVSVVSQLLRMDYFINPRKHG